ncbi:hypothetical protein CDL12_07882 [Handroanthus impetiginosus]|uniref:Uncharacterized protein n=1 Tax=Handroanthus impetiginosus TaxID=429701 RepID=A0A2G9HPJ0_9LAMI|nr:hypothetical protein CDL12_07882 [Handroanthus impetiginosus]
MKHAKIDRRLTLTRSASDNGLAETSLFRSWVTKSITGSGSMKAVDDISAPSRTVIHKIKRIKNHGIDQRKEE